MAVKSQVSVFPLTKEGTDLKPDGYSTPKLCQGVYRGHVLNLECRALLVTPTSVILYCLTGDENHIAHVLHGLNLCAPHQRNFS